MEPSESRRQISLLEGLVIAVLVGLLVWSARRPAEPPLEDGLPLPEMMAEGWLNADRALSKDALAGKVVVVDCWATWCPPCRAAIPELARLYAQYQPLGVEFVGLTPESAAERGTVAEFAASVQGFDWPIGYGARPTIDLLGIRAYPTVIVFGPQGNALWSSHSLEGLPEILDEALASAGRAP